MRNNFGGGSAGFSIQPRYGRRQSSLDSELGVPFDYSQLAGVLQLDPNTRGSFGYRQWGQTPALPGRRRFNPLDPSARPEQIGRWLERHGNDARNPRARAILDSLGGEAPGHDPSTPGAGTTDSLSHFGLSAVKGLSALTGPLGLVGFLDPNLENLNDPFGIAPKNAEQDPDPFGYSATPQNAVAQQDPDPFGYSATSQETSVENQDRDPFGYSASEQETAVANQDTDPFGYSASGDTSSASTSNDPGIGPSAGGDFGGYDASGGGISGGDGGDAGAGDSGGAGESGGASGAGGSDGAGDGGGGTYYTGGEIAPPKYMRGGKIGMARALAGYAEGGRVQRADPRALREWLDGLRSKAAEDRAARTRARDPNRDFENVGPSFPTARPQGYAMGGMIEPELASGRVDRRDPNADFADQSYAVAGHQTRGYMDGGEVDPELDGGVAPSDFEESQIASLDPVGPDDQYAAVQSGEGVLPRKVMTKIGAANFEALRAGRFKREALARALVGAR